VKTAVAIAHPCEYRPVIKPDDAGIAKRRKECDGKKLAEQWASYTYSGRTISATRSVIVIESTLSLNVSSRSVSANRTCGQSECSSGPVTRRASCLVIIPPTSKRNLLERHDGRQFGRRSRCRTGSSAILRRLRGSGLRAYAYSANLLSANIGNQDNRSVPALILRQFPGKNESMCPGAVGRGKDRSCFVRITVAVVDVEIEPASFGQAPGLGFVKIIKPQREALNMTPGCVL
jgi:hypothetical protein